MKLMFFTPGKWIFPFVSSSVRAGFPSPADDYIEKRLSLDELIIEHPMATFFARVEGDSMQDAGISSGDIAVVDRSLDAKHNDIILAWVDGGYTIKRLIKTNGKVFLYASNKKYKPIELTEEMDGKIWGVVISIVKKFK